MKNIALVILSVVIQSFAMGQAMEPVTWSTEYHTLEDGNVEILFKAVMDDGWHLYSQHLESDEGPVATTFTIDASDNYQFEGQPTEEEVTIAYDPNFEMNIAMFEDSTVFKQIMMSEQKAYTVKGNISFMACNDEQCVFPPEYVFEIKITK